MQSDHQPTRPIQRVCTIGLTSLFIAVLAFATISLWNSWQYVYIQKDTYGYLAPVARGYYEGTWDHVGARPFVYSAFVYVALRLGGSLNAVVAVQLALYVLGGAILFLTIRTPSIAAERRGQAPRSGDLISRIAAVSMVAMYFGLSNDHMSSVFYLGPELASSVCALVGLYAVLQLILIRDFRWTQKLALALAASACAALLVGLKPSLLAVAALLLVGAIVGLLRQRKKSPAPLIGGVILAMLSLPLATLLIDNALARKHGDVDAVLFGPRTAFCNNANIVLPLLESLDARALTILGAEGTRETAALLREVQAKGGWPLLGYNGDFCLYDRGNRLQELEVRYFGDTPHLVATTYRRLLTASIAANPLGYAQRVSRQLSEFLWSTPPVDCQEHRRAAKGRGPKLVERLIEERSLDQQSAALPSAPLSSVVCSAFEWTAGRIQASLLIAALVIALARALMGASENGFLRLHECGLILSLLTWSSSALVVASVHTFDVYRYVSVTLPLFLATFGLAGIQVAAWALDARLQRNTSPGGT